jgi:serine/threonine protein kinase
MGLEEGFVVMIGQKLRDRYHIYDRLGAGGAATVYLGRDTRTGQMVVVKIVHAHLVNDQFIGRFEREIDLLQQLDTPHIIKLYDWALREFDPGVAQVVSYLVTEFVEGHTLAEIIDTQGALPELDALALVRQIALGLSEIHRRGIVHRDIKSQNIMITPDNKAKIIDFGIAKGQDHATLTLSSHFAGTLYYAPPEQILEAHSADHRADIYALGVVLYEALTASLPVKAREMGTVASRIISGQLDPITGVSPQVAALVNHMLATRAENRPSSAEKVISQIDRIIGGPQEVQLPDRPPSAATMTMRMHLHDLPQQAPGPIYVLVTDAGEQFSLRLPETVIGRSHPHHQERPDIDLINMGKEDARTVSRRHCRVYRQGDGYFIEDLGSMNGTFLNGDQLAPGVAYSLTDGDRIAAGRVGLAFRCIG